MTWAARSSDSPASTIAGSLAVRNRLAPVLLAGGVIQGRAEYSEIDGSFTIEPPVAATPVSVPARLATPLAR